MTSGLRDHLREELLGQARTGLPVTYKELADRLPPPPPPPRPPARPAVGPTPDCPSRHRGLGTTHGRGRRRRSPAARGTRGEQGPARPSGPRVLPQGPGLGDLLPRPGRA